MSEQIVIDNEQGWLGAFTRHQAADALPNGSHVVKVKCEDGDATCVGTEATILGSIDGSELGMFDPDGELIQFFYFVEWADSPRVAVGVTEWKIAKS